ncbi:Rho guanine nucleotide exchange factor gef1 [Tolypocladium paradoxum]|uniref:Rho guanine nucleotide exchange factor gef1 n=1 Tax=Tolypocladium paradoxum TaxID=94208 RepID=A0A2S4KXT9_9HYPO|nr:Rho guanine nucleotide exchange factor gef1 [Tolypocladium paradoxum]
MATDHEPVAYETPDSFEEHMKQSHAYHFKEDQLPMIVEMSGQPITPTLENCPFCEETPGSTGNMANIEEHVGQHLRQFALISLPLPDYMDAGEESQDAGRSADDSTASDGDTRIVLSDLPEPNEPIEYLDTRESEATESPGSGDGMSRLRHREMRMEEFGFLGKSITAQHTPLNVELLLDKDYQSLADFAKKKYQVSDVASLLRLLSPEREDADALGDLDFTDAAPTAFEPDDVEDAHQQETADQYFNSRTPAGSDKERHRLVQRRNAIKYLIDTEAVFVRGMNIVEEIYKGTTEACPRLDSKTVKLIFRNSDEILEFHTSLLAQLKEAVASVYVPEEGRTLMQRGDSSIVLKHSQSSIVDPSDAEDRATSLGSAFRPNIEKMTLVHENFLRKSEQAAECLIQIQQDTTVELWLNGCKNMVKDLTVPRDLDSLLIMPMLRITEYRNLIINLLQLTPHGHPDLVSLMDTKDALITASQIISRQRNESGFKAGFARAIGKRVDKLQASNIRVREDAEYAKLSKRFGDDYLRLHMVLRAVKLYTRQVSAYVHEFLRYMSLIELVMRLHPGSYSQLAVKWVQFSVSVGDLERYSLEEHLAPVQTHMVEPLQHVFNTYENTLLAMKQRRERRLDYERYEERMHGSRTVDRFKLGELFQQYEALNDMLKKELPILSSLTERVVEICFGNFINIQANWYDTWKEKMKTVLGDCSEMPDLGEVVSTFQRDFPYAHEKLNNIGILKAAPSLPTPDFARRRSGSSMAPETGATGFGSGGATLRPLQYYYNSASRYKILWSAASLFEMNISTTKHEAGYPYLTYQAGEVFAVIAEKGELWLAKNEDDPRDQFGRIWSKHFVKLADS